MLSRDSKKKSNKKTGSTQDAVLDSGDSQEEEIIKSKPKKIIKPESGEESCDDEILLDESNKKKKSERVKKERSSGKKTNDHGIIKSFHSKVEQEETITKKKTKMKKGKEIDENNNHVYDFILKFVQLYDLCVGGWLGVCSEKVKKVVKQFMKDKDIKVGEKLNDTNISDLSGYIFAREDGGSGSFIERSVVSISGGYNVGKTKSLNDVTGYSYRSDESFATEGLSICFPSKNLTGVALVDMAGRQRPLSYDSIRSMMEFIMKMDAKKPFNERKYSLLRMPKKLRDRLFAKDTKSGEKYKELELILKKQAYHAALIEKVAVENMLSHSAFDVADFFWILVGELKWSEQQYIDFICNNIIMHNLSQYEEGFAKDIGPKSNQVLVTHNYKNSTKVKTIKELSRQFITGSFLGQFEDSKTDIEDGESEEDSSSDYEEGTEEGTEEETEDSEESEEDTEECRDSYKKDNSKAIDYSSIKTVDDFLNNIECFPEYIDNSSNASSDYEYGSSGKLKIFRGENKLGDNQSVSTYHFILGREASDAEENIKNMNSKYIKELRSRINAAPSKSSSDTRFLTKLLLSIKARLRQIYKKVNDVTVHIDKDYNLVFKHDGELELVNKDADMMDFRYVIKGNDVKIDIDITTNMYYTSVMIDSTGLFFVPPNIRPDDPLHPTLEIQDHQTIDEIIESTQLQPGQFSVVFDQSNCIMYAFGRRFLKTRKFQSGKTKEGLILYYPASEASIYARQDNDTKVIDDTFFVMGSDVNEKAEKKSTFLLRERGYGNFKYKRRLPSNFPRVIFESPIIENIDGTTIIILRSSKHQHVIMPTKPSTIVEDSEEEDQESASD